jgi:hypothetical protein
MASTVVRQCVRLYIDSDMVDSMQCVYISGAEKALSHLRTVPVQISQHNIRNLICLCPIKHNIETPALMLNIEVRKWLRIPVHPDIGEDPNVCVTH